MKRILAYTVVAFLGVFVLAACDALFSVTNTNSTNVGGATGPTPVATPAQGGYTVAVEPFDVACNAGVVSPSNLASSPVGCTLTFTATPKYANGSSATTDHLGNATWSATGGVVLIDFAGNTYNKYVKTVSVGPYTITVDVGGVKGTYSGEVR